MFKKSCDTVPLRHLNGFAALLKSNTLNRTNTHKIISAMSARENLVIFRKEKKMSIQWAPKVYPFFPKIEIF